MCSSPDEIELSRHNVPELQQIVMDVIVAQHEPVSDSLLQESLKALMGICDKADMI